MTCRPIIAPPIFEDTSTVHQFYIRGGDGAPIVPADVSAITLRVYDKDTATLIATRNLDPEDVVLEEVQPTATDPRWITDRRGYNFSNTTLPTDLPAGDKTVVFEYKFELADGTVSHSVVEQPTLPLFGS